MTAGAARLAYRDATIFILIERHYCSLVRGILLCLCRFGLGFIRMKICNSSMSVDKRRMFSYACTAGLLVRLIAMIVCL